MDEPILKQTKLNSNSSEAGQVELLQRLLDDPEWRGQFLENPQKVLAAMGLDVGLLDTLQLEENPEQDSQPLAGRQSKSAWFGGNPFG